MAELDARDVRLLAQVHGALEEHDPVPQAVIESARASLTWLSIDAELASLADDSALASTGVRTETAARVLTFECSTGVVVLEVTSRGDERRLVGQADRAARLQVRHRGGTVEVETDEHGRFRAEGVLSGPVSVVCTFHDSPEAPIVTSWVVV